MVDKAVKTIRPADRELAAVQDNLAQVIQQLLDQANGAASQQLQLYPTTQMVRGPGTPTSVKQMALFVHGRPDGNYVVGQPTMQFGDAQVVKPNTQTIPQKDVLLYTYGQAVFWGSQGLGDSFIIIPMVQGIAFRVTDVGNTQSVFRVSTSGQVTALGAIASTTQVSAPLITADSFVSAAGFKTVVSVGGYWNSAYAANTLVQMATAVVNNSTAIGATAVGSTPFVLKITHTASIVGMSLNQAGPNTGTNALLIYKNGSLVFTWTAGAGGNNTAFWTTYTKSAPNLSFAAGDTLTCYYRNTAAANTQVTAHLTLEMAA